MKLVSVVAGLTLLAACADEPEAPPAKKTAAPQVLTVTQVKGFSPFVTNARGRTVYRFDGDTNRPPTSTCFADCVKTWEPVLASSVQVASGAIETNLVGTVERPEGRQVTLNGWPLYYFKDDRRLGQTAGHGRDGAWFAIAPNGMKAQVSLSTKGVADSRH